MSIFQNQIGAIAKEIQYHKDQITIAEQELYSLKAAEEFVIVASTQVKDAIEHIESRYIEMFKEHLLSLFEGGEQPSQIDTTAELVERVVEEVVEEDTTTTTTTTTITPATEVVQLSDNIYYSSTEQTAYLGFTNKGRGRVYGDYLCGTHTVGSNYSISNKPKFCIGAKYELVVKDISYNHTEKLSNSRFAHFLRS